MVHAQHRSNMASFSVKSFDKKLKEMSARQDSVQTVSLWLIHHRAHSKSVVNIWLDRMKKAKPDRRLVLFYLANDVIQNSRKKGKEFSQSFCKVLGDSMQYLRDTSIRSAVERVLKIWQERKVFDSKVVQKLLDQLYDASAKPKSKQKPKSETSEKETDQSEAKVKKEKKPKRPVPANFKTTNVTHGLATIQGMEDETERRQTLVNQMRLDASSSDGIKQLKDYAGGNRFSLEFEESSTKYEDLLQSLESESQQREFLINLLEDSEAYYQAALEEATIIANAYRSFGNRLHSMKKKLDNKIRKFATAEKEAPVSAPKASFLTSGLTAILEQMNESPGRTPSGSETETKDDTKRGETSEASGNEENEKKEEHAKGKDVKSVDPSVDHVEVSDMDLDSDSENEKDDTEHSSAPQLSDSNSNTSDVSTPKPVPLTSVQTTSSPKVQPTPQYGYTVTVNNSEVNEASSPVSPSSAPSPDGSPELNLEIYEGTSPKNVLPRNQFGVMTNQSFLSGVFDQQRPDSNSTGPNTTNMLTQSSENQQQIEESSVEGVSSSEQDTSMLNIPVQDKGNGGPFIDLPGNLLGPLVHADTMLQLEEISQSGVGVSVSADQQDVCIESVDPVVVSNQVQLDTTEAASKLDSGPSTDEEGAAGDNTPEHGLDFAQVSPIIIRSDTMFPRLQAPPTFPIVNQVFPSRPRVGAPFMQPEKMPVFSNQPSRFIHDSSRRPSIEERLMEEQHLRSLGMKSPHMQGQPIEWEHVSSFAARGNAQPVPESRDPRLRRREIMMDRSGEGPPFIDRIPAMEMRGRRPEMIPTHDRDVALTFVERQRLPTVDVRSEIRREFREELLQRRLSVGDDNISPSERERRVWELKEGQPTMDRRSELHGERQEEAFLSGGVDIRESFHHIERSHLDGPLRLDRREANRPFELKDGIPHLRANPNIPIEKRHPIHPMDGPDGPDGMREPHHFDTRGLPNHVVDDPHQMQHPDNASDKTSTSKEELRADLNHGDKPPFEVNPQGKNAEGIFPEGSDEYFPAHMHEGKHANMDNPENSNLVENFDSTTKTQLHETHFDPPVFHIGMRPQLRATDERSVLEIRPEFLMDGHRPAFRPQGQRDGKRPVRHISVSFTPRHEGRGRFPGPRNFHPNFAPRYFRPWHENEGGRPRFPPVRDGHRLKRPGPPYYQDPAKRPHY